LATECGYRIDYIATLKLRQIKSLLKGRLEYYENSTTDQQKNKMKSNIPQINTPEDMLRSGMFKIRRKRK